MSQRIVFGAICMLCVAWVVSSYNGAVFPYDAVVALVGSIAAWVWAERPSEAVAGSAIHPHDKALGMRLRENFTQDARRFLRDHSFGQPYAGSRLDPVELIAEDWQGAEYEFEDAELDNLSAEIARLSRSLLNKLAIYSGPANRWPMGFFSVPTDEERASDWFTPETAARIKEVDDLATAILDHLDRFEKAFRRLAPDAYEQSD